MNADLKRVRDTSLEDAPSPTAKRRALSFSSPPIDSSDDSGMEDWMKVVEVRRKEAIYRQMLEYRRSYEEEARRADALEAQRRVLEASVQAVEVCWTQLVNAVRDLAGRQDNEIKDEQVLEPVLEPRIAQPALGEALAKRLPQTKQLIHRFVDLASRNSIQPTGNEELQRRCQTLQAEASSLRSNSALLQSQISTLTESRDTYHRDLQKAQKALDRQRMEHDKAEVEWSQARDRDNEAGTPGPGRPNGSGHATPNGKVEEDVKPLGNGAAPALLPDTTELEQLAQSRLQQLETLRADHVALQQEHDRLKQLAHHPSEAALRESPFFQIYLHQLSTHTDRANYFQTSFQAAEANLDKLRTSNQDFRDAVNAEAKAESDALRQQIAKQNSDLARLRGQRDEMNAELTERRSRETEKMRHGEQMEALASSRQDRIGFLTSEVRRLKGRLGAEAGSKGYLEFLREGGIDGDYVKDLEARVADAEGRATALSQTTDTTAQAEGEARVELEKARRALDKYELVLGPNPDAAGDITALAQRLEAADKDKAALQLQLGEAEAATNALYTEVEGLSKLWEASERTVSSKVFELKDTELKIARLQTEKAKADNKYFQAMRSKDAIDAEGKLAQRTVEKQLKLLERAQEVERSLNAQISAYEKALTSVKNDALALQTQLAGVAAEKTQLEVRLQHSQSSLADAQQIMHQRVAEANAEKAARDRLQEEVEAGQRAVKKLKERQEIVSASGGSVSANEVQMKDERDKLLKLLRCSCCEQNFKQQVITKCMHTFCKQCLDARVASRQRKCPACGLAFAKEDIQTLYWQ
ncbi:hypothetical protein EHS25_009299 [Saitozyma podzolica]|uniref:E3 ubiquitin protein ligase n=1 Tax=Saitozyma podzolica TaxID=1890683 RepID=A0A427YLK2_9TREE|nr:hypothetical protein EHS25_009299 [Saitozyma podzolica]